MHQTLTVFQLSGQMAAHAGQRQAVVAGNIAHADTPGYQARRIAPFADSYRAAPSAQMKQTRAGHMAGSRAGSAGAEVTLAAAEPAPNGNTVSLEEELLHSTEVAREHSRALTIYRHGMTVLKTTLGRS